METTPPSWPEKITADKISLKRITALRIRPAATILGCSTMVVLRRAKLAADRGAALLEFSLAAACIAVVIIVSMSLFGHQTAATFQCAGAAMERGHAACLNTDEIPTAAPLGGISPPAGQPF
jgi:Flp pilus assembly pilin Flp